MSSAESDACTSENVITKSVFKAPISSNRAVLNPLTRGFTCASGGGVKKAMIPTTLTHAPIRQSQSADSADKQTIRSGMQFISEAQSGQFSMPSPPALCAKSLQWLHLLSPTRMACPLPASLDDVKSP